MILMTVQGVSKSFGMKSVLKDISLTLQQGARMGLIGVNGSGKSTLFRLIAGQMEPDEGTISLMRGTRVGMLTQEADIQSDLTVREELSRVFEPVRGNGAPSARAGRGDGAKARKRGRTGSPLPRIRPPHRPL